MKMQLHNLFTQFKSALASREQTDARTKKKKDNRAAADSFTKDGEKATWITLIALLGAAITKRGNGGDDGPEDPMMLFTDVLSAHQYKDGTAPEALRANYTKLTGRLGRIDPARAGEFMVTVSAEKLTEIAQKLQGMGIAVAMPQLPSAEQAMAKIQPARETSGRRKATVALSRTTANAPQATAPEAPALSVGSALADLLAAQERTQAAPAATAATEPEPKPEPRPEPAAASAKAAPKENPHTVDLPALPETFVKLGVVARVLGTKKGIEQQRQAIQEVHDYLNRVLAHAKNQLAGIENEREVILSKMGEVMTEFAEIDRQRLEMIDHLDDLKGDHQRQFIEFDRRAERAIERMGGILAQLESVEQRQRGIFNTIESRLKTLTDKAIADGNAGLAEVVKTSKQEVVDAGAATQTRFTTLIDEMKQAVVAAKEEAKSDFTSLRNFASRELSDENRKRLDALKDGYARYARSLKDSYDGYTQTLEQWKPWLANWGAFFETKINEYQQEFTRAEGALQRLGEEERGAMRAMSDALEGSIKTISEDYLTQLDTLRSGSETDIEQRTTDELSRLVAELETMETNFNSRTNALMEQVEGRAAAAKGTSDVESSRLEKLRSAFQQDIEDQQRYIAENRKQIETLLENTTKQANAAIGTAKNQIEVMARRALESAYGMVIDNAKTTLANNANILNAHCAQLVEQLVQSGAQVVQFAELAMNEWEAKRRTISTFMVRIKAFQEEFEASAHRIEAVFEKLNDKRAKLVAELDDINTRMETMKADARSLGLSVRPAPRPIRKRAAGTHDPERTLRRLAPDVQTPTPPKGSTVEFLSDLAQEMPPAATVEGLKEAVGAAVKGRPTQILPENLVEQVRAAGRIEGVNLSERATQIVSDPSVLVNLPADVADLIPIVFAGAGVDSSMTTYMFDSMPGNAFAIFLADVHSAVGPDTNQLNGYSDETIAAVMDRMKDRVRAQAAQILGLADDATRTAAEKLHGYIDEKRHAPLPDFMVAVDMVYHLAQQMTHEMADPDARTAKIRTYGANVLSIWAKSRAKLKVDGGLSDFSLDAFKDKVSGNWQIALDMLRFYQDVAFQLDNDASLKNMPARLQMMESLYTYMLRMADAFDDVFPPQKRGVIAQTISDIDDQLAEYRTQARTGLAYVEKAAKESARQQTADMPAVGGNIDLARASTQEVTALPSRHTLFLGSDAPAAATPAPRTPAPSSGQPAASTGPKFLQRLLHILHKELSGPVKGGNAFADLLLELVIDNGPSGINLTDLPANYFDQVYYETATMLGLNDGMEIDIETYARVNGIQEIDENWDDHVREALIRDGLTDVSPDAEIAPETLAHVEIPEYAPVGRDKLLYAYTLDARRTALLPYFSEALTVAHFLAAKVAAEYRSDILSDNNIAIAMKIIKLWAISLGDREDGTLESISDDVDVGMRTQDPKTLLSRAVFYGSIARALQQDPTDVPHESVVVNALYNYTNHAVNMIARLEGQEQLQSAIAALRAEVNAYFEESGVKFLDPADLVEEDASVKKAPAAMKGPDDSWAESIDAADILEMDDLYVAVDDEARTMDLDPAAAAAKQAEQLAADEVAKESAEVRSAARAARGDSTRPLDENDLMSVMTRVADPKVFIEELERHEKRDRINKELDAKVFGQYFHATNRIGMDIDGMFELGRQLYSPISRLLQGIGRLLSGSDAEDKMVASLAEFLALATLPADAKKLSRKDRKQMMAQAVRLREIIGPSRDLAKGGWGAAKPFASETPSREEIATIVHSFEIFAEIMTGDARTGLIEQVRASVYLIWAIECFQQTNNINTNQLVDRLYNKNSETMYKIRKFVDRLYSTETIAWNNAVRRLEAAAREMYEQGEGGGTPSSGGAKGSGGTDGGNQAKGPGVSRPTMNIIKPRAELPTAGRKQPSQTPPKKAPPPASSAPLVTSGVMVAGKPVSFDPIGASQAVYVNPMMQRIESQAAIQTQMRVANMGTMNPAATNYLAPMTSGAMMTGMASSAFMTSANMALMR